MWKFRNIEQIRCDTRHNLSDFCFVKIRIGKFLQMLEYIVSHVCFNLRTHYVTGFCHVESCEQINYLHNQKKTSHSENHFSCQSVCSKSCICQSSQNHRQHHICKCCKRRAEQIKHQNEFVFFKIRHYPFYQIKISFHASFLSLKLINTTIIAHYFF